MQRDLGTVTAEQVRRKVIEWWYFIRLDLASPIGVRRFTDRPTSFTGNIDGTSELWTAVDVRVGRLDEKQQPGSRGALAVSKLSFANLEFTWTNWANSPGLRKARVQIWRADFNADGSYGVLKRYDGRIDNYRPGRRFEVAIKPGRSRWAARIMVPVPGLHPALPAPLMPKEDEVIYWNTSSRSR